MYVATLNGQLMNMSSLSATGMLDLLHSCLPYFSQPLPVTVQVYCLPTERGSETLFPEKPYATVEIDAEGWVRTTGDDDWLGEDFPPYQHTPQNRHRSTP